MMSTAKDNVKNVKWLIEPKIYENKHVTLCVHACMHVCIYEICVHECTFSIIPGSASNRPHD